LDQLNVFFNGEDAAGVLSGVLLHDNERELARGRRAGNS
jgi:hypothetical protein